MLNKREIIKYLKHFNYRTRKTEGLFLCLDCPLFSNYFISAFLKHDREETSYFSGLKCSERLGLLYKFLGKEKNFSGSCYYLQKHVNELIKEAHSMHSIRLKNEWN